MISKMKILLIPVCILVLICSMLGCSRSNQGSRKEKKGTGIYYTNKNYVSLVFREKKIDVNKNGQLGAEELIDAMQKKTKDSTYKNAIPNRVVVNSVTVLNNVASIDFSTGYKKISNNQDLICRAAIVYTLTQLKAINYVEFYIAGQAMLDTDGKAIGALSKESFVFGELPVDLKSK